MPARRRGFTLVELLVVVGIISVLIAILLPGLNKARKHAREVQCAANLRSMGHSLTMYVLQYRYYPGCYNQAGVVWPVRLRELMGNSLHPFNCPAQDERFYWTASGTGGHSPLADQRAYEFGYAPGEHVVTTGSYFTYGYNMWGTGDRPNGTSLGLGCYVLSGEELRYPKKDGYVQIHASRVKVASDMIAIADSTPDGIWDVAIDAPVSEVDGIGFPRGFPGAVHRGGANVLFCDGHVQWHLQKELVDYSGPEGKARRRRWHNDHEP